MTKFAILCVLALASTTHASRRRPIPDANAAMSSTSPSTSQPNPMSRSSPHYSPVNPELAYLLKNTIGYPELAALARAARQHRTRGRSAVFVPSPQFDPRDMGEAANFVARPQQQQQASSGGERTAFRPSQPIRPVYHATPLHQFGVQEAGEEREAANYIVQMQQEPGTEVTSGERTEIRLRQPIRPVYHAIPVHQFGVQEPVEEREAANYVRPQQQPEATASDGEQPEFRPRQPLTPVYHATPLRPFGVLLDTAEESRDANSFAAPTSRGVATDDGDATTTGGSMGRLTEAIFPGRVVGEHAAGVAVVEARSHEHAHTDEQANTGGAYEFGYAVRDERGGNFFGHSERRDALGTSGTYHVFLPDGRLQSVKYTADHEGFHAHVSYKRPDLKQ